VTRVSQSTLALAGDYTVEAVAGRVEEADVLLDPASGPCVDEDVFKAAMRVLPAGVVMVTTRVDGRPWGLTISSCCSLTLRPPQILVWLRLATASAQAILADGRLGVSLLASSQRPLAERGAASGVARFIDEYCDGLKGGPVQSPIVSGSLYHLDCRVTDCHRVGDHMLFIGLVEHAVSPAGNAEKRPLLYFDRRFWQLGEAV
jgi:flavin reductase ActVB